MTDKYLESGSAAFARECVKYLPAYIRAQDAYGCNAEALGLNMHINRCEYGGGVTQAGSRTIWLNGSQIVAMLHELGHIFANEPWEDTCGGQRRGGLFPTLTEALEKFLSDPRNAAHPDYAAFYDWAYCQYLTLEKPHGGTHMYANIASWLVTCVDGNGADLSTRLAQLPPELQSFYEGFIKGASGPAYVCHADVDGDGEVDGDDVQYIIDRSGTVACPPSNPNCSGKCNAAGYCYDPAADVNGDGRIDIVDIARASREVRRFVRRTAQPVWPDGSECPSETSITYNCSGDCLHKYIVTGSSSVAERHPDMYLRGYPLADLGAQPYVDSGEYGHVLPGNVHVSGEYINQGTGITEVLTVSIYPVSGTVTANPIAQAHPPVFTFGAGQQVTSGTAVYHSHYEIAATLPASISLDGTQYCLQGALWWPTSVDTSGRYEAVSGDGADVVYSSSVFEPWADWLEPCPAPGGITPMGLSTVFFVD